MEGGRADLIPPDKAMKKRILILVALVALIVLGLTGVAMAEEPVSMKMDLSATRSFVENAKKTREKIYPQLKGLEKMSDEEFVKAMPNYCSVL